MGSTVDSTVGIVGLGAMGRPIAGRLTAAGYRVVGCDPHATAVGVDLRATPREVAAEAALVLVLVGSDEQVLDVVCRPEDGLLAGTRPGHVILIGSTVAPATSLEAGRAAAPHGVEVLDAALARGAAQAEDGTLLVLAGGPVDVLARVRPVLDRIASDVHHVGGLGAGQVAKMLNNYLLWLAVVGNYEAMRLGTRMGLDAEALRSALLSSSGANWALDTWHRPRPMPWAEADMAILLACADEYRLPMAAAGTVRELIEQLKLEKADVAGVDASMAETVRVVEGGSPA
jgi:3-hydroxyisobutyrate dehydrogenase-like beta-hydroxyacid dehydrogenase